VAKLREGGPAVASAKAGGSKTVNRRQRRKRRFFCGMGLIRTFVLLAIFCSKSFEGIRDLEGTKKIRETKQMS
jgi:hypothetical protein